MPVTSDALETRAGGYTPDPIVAPDSQTPGSQVAVFVAPHLNSMELPSIASHLANRSSMIILEQTTFGRFRLMNHLTYTSDLT